MFEQSAAISVQALGEQGLLKRLQQFCPGEIIGDDAAVLVTAPGKSLVVTTDVLVDGVHFAAGFGPRAGTQTMSPEDVGWRAAAANLSDLAAMGASPLGVTIGLGLPGTLPVAWVEQLYQGICECLNTYNTVILGGDVCRSPVISLGITALGQVFPAQVIRRGAAVAGDKILITGIHGASRAGLELLLPPSWGEDLSQADRATLIQSHQRPRPRLEVPPLLRSLAPQARVAGMDSSDGLADALLQICRASGVGARIERSQVPLPPALLKMSACSPEQAMEWALYGGEDFELVLCLAPELAEFLMERLGNGAAIVGEIVPGSEVKLVDSTGANNPVALSMRQGFQHFSDQN